MSMRDTYLHYAVYKPGLKVAFCGADARERAIAFAGRNSAIWAMTELRVSELGLTSPGGGHEMREIILEADELFAINGVLRKSRP